MISAGKKLLLAVLVTGCSPLMSQQWTLGNLSTPLRITDADARSYDAFPAMMKAANGKVFNFFRKATSHAADRGVIMLRTSVDGGVTWLLHDNGSGGVDISHRCLAGDPRVCIFADAALDTRNNFGGVSYDGSTLIIGWNIYNHTRGT